MQRAVEFRFRDTSTLVREAAVDLVGRFVLSRPELTSQYYDMICERIRVSLQLYCTYKHFRKIYSCMFE
jgi:cohesin loading factor subunit SCC2